MRPLLVPLLAVLIAGCAAQPPAAFGPLSTMTLDQAMRSYPATAETQTAAPAPAENAVYDYRPAALTKNTCTQMKRSILMQNWEVTTTYLGALPITKGPVIDEQHQLIIAGAGPVATCEMAAALVVYTPGEGVMSLGLRCHGVQICAWSTSGHFNSRSALQADHSALRAEVTG